MKIIFHFLLFLFLAVQAYSQQYNLVPNYSFEDSVLCPKFLNNPPPKPWYIPSNFFNGAFLHACSMDTVTGVPYNYIGYKSYQYARTGLGYLMPAFYGSDFRIYIQVKLKDSLRKGHCYECTFYASLPNVCIKASNNISMLLTKTKIYSDTLGNPTGLAVIPANAQVFNYGNPIITDTLNWVKVSSVYVATGEESFITIGNFKNDAQTQTATVNTSGTGNVYYYIDDVSITPLDSITLKADAGTDRTIANGSSTYIGSYTNGLTNVSWFSSAGTVIATGVPGLTVSPSSSTFYVIEQTVCGQYSRDTVYVNVGAVPLTITRYEVATSLRGTKQSVENSWQTNNEVNVSHFNVQRSSDGANFHTVQQVQAKNNAYNEYGFTDLQPLNGTSYYRIEAVDRDGKRTYSKTLPLALSIQPYAFSIYPNPTSTVINISGNNIKNVELLDMHGKLLVTKKGGIGNITMPLTNLPSGMYLLKVTDNSNQATTNKFFKYQ